jgi:hypothetical protein
VNAPDLHQLMVSDGGDYISGQGYKLYPNVAARPKAKPASFFTPAKTGPAVVVTAPVPNLLQHGAGVASTAQQLLKEGRGETLRQVNKIVQWL